MLVKNFPALTRASACALLILLWAAIYLPGLGAVEIKGEEIRRIMPAVNMLQTGDWILPQYNGAPYLRKPPLVNWAIALSIRAFGVCREWTARFPSALAVLLLVLVTLMVCAPWLGLPSALAAALVILTTGALVEKGRIAEIESIYIALFGIAIVCWLAWVATARSPWLVWPVTGFILGLGLLAKGPLHLLFFYALTAPIAFLLARQRRQPSPGAPPPLPTPAFFSWAHLCGLLIMLAIFAAWCIPYMQAAARLDAAGVWARQMGQRIGGGDHATAGKNFIHSIINLLPWVLGLPLFWRRATLDKLAARDRAFVLAARWPLVIGAFFLMLIPGMLPRYTLPLLVPYAILLTLLLQAQTAGRPLRWPLAAALLAACGMLIFGLGFGPWLARRGAARDFGRRVNQVAPPGAPIVVFEPSVQPDVFYLRPPLLFIDTVKNLAREVPCIVAPDVSLKILRGHYRDCRPLIHLRDFGGHPFTVLALREPVSQR